MTFGEPGTTSQHSFFQLLHMGQTVPADFIGFAQPAAAYAHLAHDAVHVDGATVRSLWRQRTAGLNAAARTRACPPLDARSLAPSLARGAPVSRRCRSTTS